jgi:hypothetical protein
MKCQCILFAAALMLAGCSTRSISNSGYRESGFWGGRSSGMLEPGFAYRGELNEFDVLGISRDTVTSDTEIERTLAGAKRVRLNEASSILLVQSGAMFPDGPMVAELSKHFRVVPFSGVPDAELTPGGVKIQRATPESFSKSLRLAAARGGNDVILCYWGILESANEKLPTKTISWVPVVNWMIPDERQSMRLRLKMALVDVRTGDWAVLSPAPVNGNQINVSPRRGVADQQLVETLKVKAYAGSVRALLQQYSDPVPPGNLNPAVEL